MVWRLNKKAEGKRELWERWEWGKKRQEVHRRKGPASQWIGLWEEKHQQPTDKACLKNKQFFFLLFGLHHFTKHQRFNSINMAECKNTVSYVSYGREKSIPLAKLIKTTQIRVLWEQFNKSTKPLPYSGKRKIDKSIETKKREYIFLSLYYWIFC